MAMNSGAARDGERKAGDGLLIRRNPREALPKSEVTLESLPALEALVVSRLRDHDLLQPETEGGA